jgi:hypothetical protein
VQPVGSAAPQQLMERMSVSGPNGSGSEPLVVGAAVSGERLLQQRPGAHAPVMK